MNPFVPDEKAFQQPPQADPLNGDWQRGYMRGNPYPEPDKIDLDAQKPAPYGMTPGQRHFLPGITPVVAGPQAAPMAPPKEDDSQYRDEHGHEYGIVVHDPETGAKIELRPNLERSKEARARKINALGQALMTHAHTDQEKDAAERAAAWGLAQADTDIPLEHVVGEMDKSYQRDTGYEQALVRQRLANEGKLATVRANHKGGGVGGPNLKQLKFDTQEEDKANHGVQEIIEHELNHFDIKKIESRRGEYESALENLQHGNGAQQHYAIQQLVSSMSGKTVSDRERSIYEGLNGLISKWESAANGIFANPELERSYRDAIVQLIQSGLSEMDKQRDMAAELAANRAEYSGYLDKLDPEKKAKRLAGVRSALSGKVPTEQSAPQPPKPQEKTPNITDFVGH